MFFLSFWFHQMDWIISSGNPFLSASSSWTFNTLTTWPQFLCNIIDLSRRTTRQVQHDREDVPSHKVSSPESNLDLCIQTLPWCPLFLFLVWLSCYLLPAPEQAHLYWFQKSSCSTWRQTFAYTFADPRSWI